VVFGLTRIQFKSFFDCFYLFAKGESIKPMGRIDKLNQQVMMVRPGFVSVASFVKSTTYRGPTC